MATYKYPAYLEKNESSEFDYEHAPGSATPHSGIYRCLGCGRELVSEQYKPFPPQNHHQHAPAQGHIRWRLVAYADHQPK
jgi:hypothetical protein